MQPRGVLITARVGDEICSRCCGIKISDWVLTHGTIVLPFMQKEVCDVSLRFNGSEINFDVLIQKDHPPYNNALTTNESESYNATLVGFYEDNYLSSVIKKSLSGWIEGEIKLESKEILTGLSLFVLLKLEDLRSDCVPNNFKLKNEPFHLGMDILVESTPFAATPFFNSWSTGVVSKVLDSKNQLILIDTRTAVGCEGAPIFSYENGKPKNLLGMVISVLNWSHEELVGLTLGCCIYPVLQYFNMVKTIPTTLKLKTYLDTVKAAVVFIRSGNMWGSGVVIDSKKGIILTCSHVIENSETPVYVLHKLLQNKRLPAKIVYATAKNRPYDLAVLKVSPNSCLQQLNLSNSLPDKGAEVVSAGYSFFSENDPMGLGMTVSLGTISYLDKKGPLHVTSSVHPGASGGAIFKPPNQLVGIIVCNSKVGNYILPKFSMGLSVTDFYWPLKQYLDTDDPKFLNELTVKDDEVIMKWNLNFTSKL